MSYLLCAVLFATALADIDTKFTRSPESVSAPLGDEVAFDCSVSVPAERLAWRRRTNSSQPWTPVEHTVDGEAISVSPPRSNATKLTINLRDRDLAGEYQCVVWYGAIVLASVPAKLSVAEMKLTDLSNKDVFVAAPVGNTVVLHCPKVESNPPAVYSWWKMDSGGSKRPLETPFGVLVIPKAALDNSGTYGCTATNEISGEATDLPGKILLKIQTEDVPLSTRFLEHEEALTFNSGRLEARVLAGTTLRLWCGAVGHPAPTVSWRRYGGDDTLPARARVDPGLQSLVVPAFESEDEGDYECNAGGLRRRWRALALSAARWAEAAVGARATEGGSAHVRCRGARGQPPPAVSWLLNAEPLVPSDNIHIQGEHLYIQHVEKRHAGIVQCFAENELGAQYESTMLIVVPVQISGHDIPQYKGGERSTNIPSPTRRRNRKNKGKSRVEMVPPSVPVVTRMSDSSVMVSWRAGEQGLPIQFFKVQHRDLTARTAWKTANMDIPHYMRAYQVDGLAADHEYKFRIAAVYKNNDNNVSNSTGRIYLRRGESGLRAPRAPALAAVTPVSTTQLAVDWTWSQGSGPAADGFYVYYRRVTDAGLYMKATGGGRAARRALLAHLDSDTQYEVKVQAYTETAPSEFSAIKAGRTLANATSPPPPPPPPPTPPAASGPPGVYPAAGGAAALLAVVIALLLCRRRTRPQEKQPTPTDGDTNGYLPGKVPITITTNPLHAETDGLEMPYLHNNNRGSPATPPPSPPPQPRPRKHSVPPPARDYV